MRCVCEHLRTGEITEVDALTTASAASEVFGYGYKVVSADMTYRRDTTLTLIDGVDGRAMGVVYAAE